MNELELRLFRSIAESMEHRLAEISDALHKISDRLEPAAEECVCGETSSRNCPVHQV